MATRIPLLLAILCLSACGDNMSVPHAADNTSVAVKVTGLAGQGLVLQLDGGHDLAIPGDGRYSFTAPSTATTPAVTVRQQPSAPSQRCMVSSDVTIARGASEFVVVCTTNTYRVGGNVAGLAGSGLVLGNGSELLAVAADGTFEFTQPVPSGEGYAVTVAQQPASPTQTCTVSGGSGVIGGADVGSVTVVCDTNRYALGGTATGLAGGSVVLHDEHGGDATVSANGSFAFPDPLPSGTPFAVTVTQQPSSPSQTCIVTGDTGTVTDQNVSTIAVSCTVNEYTVSGTVTGLAGSGLVLQNKLGDDLPVTANGTFTFTAPVQSGTTYSVSVLSQPSSPSQTCTVSSATGTIGGAPVTDVTVTCTTNSYRIRGTVSGLAGTGLVLANGSDQTNVDAGGTFEFPVAVASGDSFDVTVAQQPTAPWQTCTVVGGQGTVGAADVTSIAVSCGTDEHLVGGTVTGLAGAGLKLQLAGGATVAVGADGAFAFPAPLPSGTSYDVTVAAQPTSPWQTCTVASGSGTIGGTDVTGVQVSCTTNHYTIGGSVTGLAGSGLKLHVGSEDLAVSSDGSFAFTTAVASGQPYAVTVTQQPSSPAQTCTVTSGGGVVGGGNISDVAVTCGTNRYHVGGTVSGLLGTLVVANGTDALTLTANGSFTFGATVPSGDSYAVTVTTQPSSPAQQCTVTAGGGTVTTADIADVSITCATNQYTVGGTVSGLEGGAVVLRNNDGDDLTVSDDGTFTFATPVASGQPFSVTVATQPSAPAQTCIVTAGDGTVGGAAVTSVSVNCSTNTYSVGGTVTGLAGSGLVLQNNGGDDLSVPSDGSYAFATPVESGDTYAVTVKTQPSSPAQTCTVTGGDGTVGGAAVTSVSVTCVTRSFRVGVTLSGLDGAGLKLQNNGGDDLAISANGTVWFTTPVLSGGNYSVTVLQQPVSPWQTCSVASASGVVGGSDVTLAVTCTTKAYTIGGTVSGLTASGLVLQNNGGDDLPVSASGTFAFVTPVSSGQPFSVTVATQPSAPAQTCTVTGGDGTVGGAAVTSVSVTCVTRSFRVGVTVSGLDGAGLKLQNNGGDDLAISANGTVWFTTPVLSGGNYSVTVLQQPVSPWQTCSVGGASGVMGGSDVTLAVTCMTNAYTIGGTVSGLGTSGLVLQNNGGDDLPVSASGTFAFVTPVTSGGAYAVTIKTQPSGQTCSVSTGSGTVAGANVSSVSVICEAFINGSFETGDYTGWTLWTEDVNDISTSGIGTDGDTVTAGGELFDYATNQSVEQSSFGLPITFEATDGTKVAVALQGGPTHRRMYQDVMVPSGVTMLAWDMYYDNDFESFDASAQYLAIYLRDPSTDAILATLFKPNDAENPQELATMTAFNASVSAYAGQVVRVDVEVLVQFDYLDAVFDNFRFE